MKKAFLKKMLINSRSTTFLLNSCAHHIIIVIDEVGYKIIYFKSDDKLSSATG